MANTRSNVPGVTGTSDMPSAVRSSTSHPLSFAQLGAWLRGQEKGPAYQYVALYRLNGHLQVDALEQGLNELVRRHEVLRTTYQNQSSGPVQVIHDACPLLSEPSIFALCRRLRAKPRRGSWRRPKPEGIQTSPAIRCFVQPCCSCRMSNISCF